MIKIYELETKNGRTYRVAITNKNQEKRLHKIIKDSEKNKYEKIIRVEVIMRGIQDIGEIEAITKELL